jgi:ribosomal protein L37E
MLANLEHEQCGRCGRKLKTEASRQAGFGPVCKRKWEAAKAQDEQLNGNDVLEAQDANE